jgi:hypothetical protein
MASTPTRACALAVMAVAAAAGVLSTAAVAAPAVTLQASLNPDRLGADTAVSIGFQIPNGAAPGASPLTEFDVRLPPEMGLAATTLGLATCSAHTLLDEGPTGCPPNAVMGSGTALAESAFGSETIRESARVFIYMGPATSENTTMLYYFDGQVPVIAPLVFPSQFVSNATSLRSEFMTSIPTVAALPGAADVAILSMHATIGPRGLRYVRRVGKRVATYKPVGMSVPGVCPRRGFPFSGVFVFQNGARVVATHTVPCPH